MDKKRKYNLMMTETEILISSINQFIEKKIDKEEMLKRAEKFKEEIWKLIE